MIGVNEAGFQSLYILSMFVLGFALLLGSLLAMGKHLYTPSQPFVHALQCQTGKCDNNCIRCQQNNYLSINGHQKTKETSKLKTNC